MNYNTKQTTPAYQSLAAYRYGGQKKKKKYNTGGGMYGSNTVSSAGQVSSTSNIVYQESDPQVLAAKREGMEAEKARLLNQSEMTQQEVQQAEDNTQAIANEAAQEPSKVENAYNSVKGLVETSDMLTDGKIGDLAKKAFQPKPALGADPMGIRSGSKLLSGKPLSLAQPSTGLTLGGGSGGLGSTSLIDKSSSLFKSTPSFTPPGSFTPGSIGGTPTFNPTLMSDKPISLSSDLSKGVGTLGSTVTKEAGKGLMSTTGVGAAGVGSGVGKFLTSGAGIGTVASLAGMGVSALADDGDETKLNFGEGTGAVLSGIGTGIGAATLTGMALGSAVPVLGNVIGAVAGAAYGLGKALVGRRKARKAKAKHEQEIKDKKAKHNKDLMSNLGTQQSIVRNEELAQKTYSGYDLGKNVNYRLGGAMQPLMKYGK